MATKLKIEHLNPASLTPYAKNSKIHSDEQIDLIAKNIATYGFDVPVVVDKKHVIIKGHGRTLAALRLKLKTIPVLVRTDLTLKEANLTRIADNRLAELGKWDDKKLKDELAELLGEDIDLTLSGFSQVEIDNLLDDGENDDDEGEEKGEKESRGKRLVLHYPKERFKEINDKAIKLITDLRLLGHTEVTDLASLFEHLVEKSVATPKTKTRKATGKSEDATV